MDNVETDAVLEKVRTQVEDFLTQTESARVLSERDRDYVDHKQWTDEQIKKLGSRKHPHIVVNRIKPKVNGLKGLVSLRRSDPKAYPRTTKHEKSADAITDALRYVADANDFNDTKMQVVDDFFVEGYGGAIVHVRQKKSGDIEVIVDEIPWDRIYFDPFSRKKDFSDARFKGMILWMDAEEVTEHFPDVTKEDMDALLSSSGGMDTTFEDRPRWVDKKQKRVRVAMHYYKKDGAWWMCAFTDTIFLIEPQESPFLDDEGEPCCPIELVCAYIDRDNNRYGEVRGFIDQQDEINHRRSKFLHLLSARQTAAKRGAVKDIAAMKSELAKPDGHVEYTGEKGEFEILQTGDMARGQFELYQDAKGELDAVSFNAQLAGERQIGDLSGKAIDRLQQAGTIELNDLFSALNGWEKRIYRHIWARIKQFWTEEKWIRVTDDQDALRWVGLNAQVTAKEFLEELINDESAPVLKRKQAAATFQMLMAKLHGEDQLAAQKAQQAMDTPVNVKNPVPEIDVDIILDQSFDSVNIQQEQFQVLAQFAQGSDIDIIELIELSQLRGKEALIEKIESRRAASQEAQGNIIQIKAEAEKAKNMKTMSEVQLNAEASMQKRLENMILQANPADIRPQVAT